MHILSHVRHCKIGIGCTLKPGEQKSAEWRKVFFFFLEEVWGAGWREGVIKLRAAERIDIWPNKGVPQTKVPDEPY